MEKQLLLDYIPFQITPELVKESVKKNDGRLIVSGVIQRADEKNQNGRVYPRKILDRELIKYDALIKERRALGELDHPDSSIIELKNVSHNIIKTWWDKNDLYAEIEILNTPSGRILRELVEAGIKIGISSRGMGSVKDIGEGLVEVEDDFDLIGWDFVSNPSTHGAFMNLKENVNESIDPKLICRNKIECLIRDILMELN
jgi:hypothetical protein